MTAKIYGAVLDEDASTEWAEAWKAGRDIDDMLLPDDRFIMGEDAEALKAAFEARFPEDRPGMTRLLHFDDGLANGLVAIVAARPVYRKEGYTTAEQDLEIIARLMEYARQGEAILVTAGPGDFYKMAAYADSGLVAAKVAVSLPRWHRYAGTAKAWSEVRSDAAASERRGKQAERRNKKERAKREKVNKQATSDAAWANFDKALSSTVLGTIAARYRLPGEILTADGSVNYRGYRQNTLGFMGWLGLHMRLHGKLGYRKLPEFAALMEADPAYRPEADGEALIWLAGERQAWKPPRKVAPRKAAPAPA